MLREEERDALIVAYRLGGDLGFYQLRFRMYEEKCQCDKPPWGQVNEFESEASRLLEELIFLHEHAKAV